MNRGGRFRQRQKEKETKNNPRRNPGNFCGVTMGRVGKLKTARRATVILQITQMQQSVKRENKIFFIDRLRPVMVSFN